MHFNEVVEEFYYDEMELFQSLFRILKLRVSSLSIVILI